MYQNLKALRESLKMTQAEFGKSIGLAKSTYSHYESGEREPKSDFWIAIAKKYGVTIDYLMGFSQTPHEYANTAARTTRFTHSLGVSNLAQATMEELGAKKEISAPVSESGRNVLRIAGRDGTYVERTLTDEQLSAIKMMVDQLPDASDDL